MLFLKEGIIGNIHAKLYEIWTSGSWRCFLKTFLSRALTAPLFSGLEIWTSGSRDVF